MNPLVDGVSTLFSYKCGEVNSVTTDNGVDCVKMLMCFGFVA